MTMPWLWMALAIGNGIYMAWSVHSEEYAAACVNATFMLLACVMAGAEHVAEALRRR